VNRTVEVPTEDGRTAVIAFESRQTGVWSVYISQFLIDQAPEAITAVLTLALMQMRTDAA
jgi:hypothetical protein